MKKRIKIDSTMLAFIIIFTVILLQFRQLYWTSAWAETVLDFIGGLFIIKGVLYRMVARGHKKFHSQQGQGLVLTGIYKYVRNPMYLGSFLIGMGFALLVWPWWSLPIFGGLFYLRFIRQIKKEENHLSQLFGQPYIEYCRQVPRFFPRVGHIEKIKTKEIFIFKEAFSTKEKFGSAGWLALAFCLELFQEKLLWGIVDIKGTISLFGMAIAAFVLIFGIQYLRS